MKEYNEATETVNFDPTKLDGLSTGAKLKVPKTNWALLLDKPPYMAYGMTCGMAPLS
jgi:tricarballylate dehydrogenase